MADNYGYVGKILRVDLSTGVLTDIPTSNYAPKYIGGRAMGAKIYWDEVMPEVGAFDPENRLIIINGPVNGTPAPSGTRVSVTAKSPIPIPECYAYSIPGSVWGPQLKFAGYDGIIVQGQASEPVYLWIHDGVAEIRKAGILWGKGTRFVDQTLKQLHGDQTCVAAIGPAGENLVKEAIILFNWHSATGMGGFGAVMGSKNLKAIAVRGTGSVKVADPQAILALREEWAQSPIGLDTGDMFYGDAAWFMGQKVGRFSTHLKDAVNEGRASKKKGGCWNCQISCRVGLRFNDLEAPNGVATCNGIAESQQDDFLRTGKYMDTGGWDFTMLCNDLGIGATQILGHTIPWWDSAHHGGSWATELMWAGLWTEENTGLPIGKVKYTYDEVTAMDTTPLEPDLGVFTAAFNNALLSKVAYRQGIGDLMAEGQQRYLKHVIETAPSQLKAAAQEIYDRHIYSENYHSCWQPRHPEDGYKRYMSWAVNSVTGPAAGVIGVTTFLPINDQTKTYYEMQAKMLFGDDFDIEKAWNPYIPDHKAPLVVFEQHVGMERDSMTTCMYAAFGLWNKIDFYSRAFAATTGTSQPADIKDWYKEVGERAYNLERAIMVREGRRREHDTMNDYQFSDVSNPLLTGHRAGDWIPRSSFDGVMDEYYAIRDWDLDSGIPSRSKLEDLGMKDVADDLESKYGVKLPA